VLLVRQIAAGDHREIDRIARDLHPTWFTKEALEEIAHAAQTQRGYVAVYDGRCVGFGTYLPTNNAKRAELSWIVVQPDFHRRGAGRRLVEAIEQELAGKGYEWLEVYTVAETEEYEPYARTRRFYHAVGFIDVTIEPKGWPSGDDRLLLRKHIQASS
jgi:GNAT superfamily N-acetyltransferase